MHLSLLGYIVLSPGLFSHADVLAGARFLIGDGVPGNAALERLQFRKIHVADAVFVVNVGEAAKREIAYAEKRRKPVEWLFDPARRTAASRP